MGLSIPNPINVVKDTVDHIGDAGKAVVNKTVDAVETTVDVTQAAVGLSKDVAVGTLRFEASLTKFALNNLWDETKDFASDARDLAGRGIDAAQNGLDKVTHPGSADPPASQGLKFSETKSASEIAYKRNDAKVGDVYQFPDGKQWQVAEVKDDPKTGFRAVALKPVDPNDERVIVAFSGSDEGGDWDDNIKQGVGLTPAQYDGALDFANKWKASDGDNVILTGHSLGGGLASYAAIKTDLHATAVNSAPLTLNNIGIDVSDHFRITQYYVPGEALSVVNEANPLDARPGLNIAVQGKDSILDPRSIASNHSLDHVAPDISAPIFIGNFN